VDKQKRQWLIITALALVLIGASFVNSWDTKHDSTTDAQPDGSVGTGDGTVVVYISGAVVKPGVYRLSPGTRVADVINNAGGLADGADVNKVNLAQPVKDGAHIYIPLSAAVISATAGRSPQRVSGTTSPERVSINAADQNDLEKLPGIGPVIAKRIIEYREVNGPFHDITEIKKVSGVGEAKFNRIKDRLSL
jgi:competence protein ComEA